VYTGKRREPWLRPEKIINLFEGDSYMEFLKNYEEHKVTLEDMKYELADTT
jgi:hypothetical protein